MNSLPPLMLDPDRDPWGQRVMWILSGAQHVSLASSPVATHVYEDLLAATQDVVDHGRPDHINALVVASGQITAPLADRMLALLMPVCNRTKLGNDPLWMALENWNWDVAQTLWAISDPAREPQRIIDAMIGDDRSWRVISNPADHPFANVVCAQMPRDVIMNTIQALATPEARARNPQSLWADHLMSFLDQDDQDTVMAWCDPTEGPHVRAARTRAAIRKNTPDTNPPAPPPRM